MLLVILLNCFSILLLAIILIIHFYYLNEYRNNPPKAPVGPIGPSIGPTGPRGPSNQIIYTNDQLQNVNPIYFGPTGAVGDKGKTINTEPQNETGCLNLPLYQSGSITNSLLISNDTISSQYINIPINTYITFLSNTQQNGNNIVPTPYCASYEGTYPVNYINGKISKGDILIINCSAYSNYKFAGLHAISSTVYLNGEGYKPDNPVDFSDVAGWYDPLEFEKGYVYYFFIYDFKITNEIIGGTGYNLMNIYFNVTKTKSIQ